MILHRKIFLIATLLFIGAAGTSCEQNSNNAIRGNIIKSIISPEKTAKVIVTKDGGNATVKDVYRLYLHSEAKKNPARLLLLADNTDGVNVEWTSASSVEISMSCGRIFEYTNFSDLMNDNGELISRISVSLSETQLCE